MCDYSRFFEKVKRFCDLCHGFVLLFLSHDKLVCGQSADEDEADRVGLPAGDDEGQSADDEQDTEQPVELALDKAV